MFYLHNEYISWISLPNNLKLKQNKKLGLAMKGDLALVFSFKAAKNLIFFFPSIANNLQFQYLTWTTLDIMKLQLSKFYEQKYFSQIRHALGIHSQ